MRAICSVLLSLTSLGNLCYSFGQFSPLFLLFGRLAAGIGASVTVIPLMRGEIARSYLQADASRALCILGIAFQTGVLLGPAVNMAKHLKISLTLLNWHINCRNAVGLFLFILFVANIGSLLCFSHNLSKEYDKKAAYKVIHQFHNARVMYNVTIFKSFADFYDTVKQGCIKNSIFTTSMATTDICLKDEDNE